MLQLENRIITFFSISLFLHFGLIGLFILISYVNFSTIDDNINYIDNKIDIINVNFVELGSQGVNNKSLAKTNNPLEKLGYIKAHKKKRPNFKSLHGSNNLTNIKAQEQNAKKYEYLLSQQFTKLTPIISKLFFDLERIDIWVQIDKYGNVIDSGIAQNLSNTKLQKIKEEIIKLSPLPEPPLFNFNEHKLQQYLIPVLIK